jgi:hypothetical protein
MVTKNCFVKKIPSIVPRKIQRTVKKLQLTGSVLRGRGEKKIIRTTMLRKWKHDPKYICIY